MFNPADFRHHLEGFDLSEAEKDDYIRTLAGALDSVIDRILSEPGPASGRVDNSSKPALKAPKDPQDMVDYKHDYLTELFEECARDAALNEGDDE